MLPDLSLNKVLEKLFLCRSLFKNNPDTKNDFLALCLTIDPECGVSEVNIEAPEYKSEYKNWSHSPEAVLQKNWCEDIYYAKKNWFNTLIARALKLL